MAGNKKLVQTTIYTGRCIECKAATMTKRSMYCEKHFEAALSKKVKEEC